MMKKHNRPKKQQLKEPKENTSLSEETITPDSDEVPSFSNWLRTGEGTELMRFFVILNSLAVFLTLSWPNIKEVLTEFYYLYKDYFETDEV